MVDRTPIEWADSTWNPIRGCSRVSEGCRLCYAERMAARFSGPGRPFEGFAERRLHVVNADESDPGNRIEARWTGRVQMFPALLSAPATWKRPRRIFVNSMSDLFHEELPLYEIAAVIGAMLVAWWHEYIILTKRAERQEHFVRWLHCGRVGQARAIEAFAFYTKQPVPKDVPNRGWPPPHIRLGVSVENQAMADRRIPYLIETGWPHLTVSYEPALGPIDLAGFSGPPEGAVHNALSRIDWVIAGGESGPGARPCEADWLRSTVRACRRARVPVFVKQLGAAFSDPRNGIAGRRLRVHPDGSALISTRLRHGKGANPSEWPEDLRVREFPPALTRAA